MWIFTDVADWFDSKKKQSNAVLDRMVEDSDFSQGAMLMAASGHAFMDFGGGFVDLLRLGDGVKKGGLSGWGQDGLRVVAIFPVGKAAHLLKGVRGVRPAKFIVDVAPDVPICAWVASAKALRQVGHVFKGKVFASVEDLAVAAGKSLSTIGVVRDLSYVVNMLRGIGARVGSIREVSNMRDVERILPWDGSVVLVAIADTARRSGVTGHLIYAYRDLTGRLCIMDRMVGGVVRESFKNLSYLNRKYKASYVPFEAAVLQNVYVRSMLHELPRLVIPVPAVAAAYADGEKK